MTLGEEWKQSLDDSEKDIIFKFLENAVKDAIEEKRKYIWLTNGIRCQEGFIIDNSNEEILNEFAAVNELIITKTHYNDWIIMPKE